MGAACCVSRRDKSIQRATSGEFLHRNLRHSPTRSFRWDNRVGVVGEEAPAGRLSDLSNRNDTLDLKSATDVSAQVSDGGSPMESHRNGAWRKSSVNQAMNKSIKKAVSLSGQSVTTNASKEAKQHVESSQVFSEPSVVKFLPLSHTTSSHVMPPLSSRSHPLLPSPTPSKRARGSPGLHLAHQLTDSLGSGRNSPSNYVFEQGHVWSTHAFSEINSASQRERWSIDSDSFSIARDIISKTSGHNSASVDLQTCGVCFRLLCEKSAWGSQTITGGAELSVVAVLICGHVYHAECLETITPEINKYDPACPVCKLGEKQTKKLTTKMLKAEKGSKVRSSKKLRKVGDMNASFDLGYWKRSAGVHEGKSIKLGTSSSLKISGAKPFLKRHFSLGSKSNKSPSESPSIRKKGLFCAKSCRE